MPSSARFLDRVEPDPFAGIGPNEAPATPQETRDNYLTRARRQYAVLRRSLLVADTGPGPITGLVKARSSLPLDFYLLRLALQPVAGIEEVPLRVWARMLSGRTKVTETMVSRAVASLDEMSLLTKTTQGRNLIIHPLREDGSGEPYGEPGETSEQYFTLPFDYWVPQAGAQQPLATSLKVPGKVMLLILLAETQGRPYAEVTAERAAITYGLSTSTVDRGYASLTAEKLLRTHVHTKKAAEGYNGSVYVHYRALEAPYSQFNRDALRAAAKAAGDAKRKRPTKGGEHDHDEKAKT